MDFTELQDRIKIHEGYRDTIYLDSLGKKTIGYGHLITATDKFLEGTVYSKEELQQTFLEDFNKAVDGAKRVTDYEKLHDKAKAVAIECVFVLGARGFSLFKLCIGHLNEGRYSKGAEELKDSLWCKKQAFNRVSALCEILESIK